MKVKFKKLNEAAVTPSFAKFGDAGLDITAITRLWESDTKTFIYGTGLSVEIPEGYVGLVFPRSSIAKYDLSLTNSVGVIDSGYRGEITLKFRHNKDTLMQTKYDTGERIAQLIILPYPKVELEEVKELSKTERGSGAYGSSGK